jgi:hypothetical protein
MKLIKGEQLTSRQRAQVLAAYVYRHLDTTSKNDAEWLAKHAFYFTKADRLALKPAHCEPVFMADIA